MGLDLTEQDLTRHDQRTQHHKEAHPMPDRPMPRATRYVLVQQYTGRRQALATAVHEYLVYAENRPEIAPNWQAATWTWCRHAVQDPLTRLEALPHCLCEEDFLIAVLWGFISNDADALPAGTHTAQSSA